MKTAENKAKKAKPGAAQPARQLRPTALITGVVLGLGAALGCAIDAWNNYQFGSTLSQQMAVLMGTSAVALAATSFARPLLKEIGHSTVLVDIVIVVSLITTLLSAASSHLDAQQRDRLHREAIQRNYDDAVKDADEALLEVATQKGLRDRQQAIADDVAERASAAELQKAADDASARAKAESSKERGGCGKECKAAEKAAAEFLRRKLDAAAREAAIERAKEAEERMNAAQRRYDAKQEIIKKGSAALPGLVMTIAAQAGIAPHTAAHKLETFVAVVSIAFTIALSMFGGPAAVFVRRGLGLDEPEPVKPSGKAKPIIARAETTKLGRPRIDRDDYIERFIRERLKSGAGETSGQALYDAFTAWWEQRANGYQVPSTKRLASALKEAGITKRRTASGQMYQVAILH